LDQTIISQKSSYIVSFNFLCSAIQKFYFRGLAPSPWRLPNLIQTIISERIFLHCEFQPSMLSSLKVLFLAIFGGSPPRRTPKFGKNNCLTYNFLHCEFHLSMLSNSKVLFWGGILGGFLPPPPQRTPNLIKIIVSHTTSYIVSFIFLQYVEQFKSFILGGSPPPRRTPKFGQNNRLTYNFLHCEFQISMLSSSKVTFWGGHFGEFAPS